MNFAILVHQKVSDDTVKAIKLLLEFLDYWSEKRHGYIALPIYGGERVFRADVQELKSLAPQIVDEYSQQLQGMTYENTSVIFLALDQISIPEPDGTSSTAIGYTFLNNTPIVIYVKMGEVETPTFDPSSEGPKLRNANRFIKWNTQVGKEVSHEWTHEIRRRQLKSDKIDDLGYRFVYDYWLYSYKIPFIIEESLTDRKLFAGIEQIHLPLVAPLKQYPSINWNFVTQGLDENW